MSEENNESVEASEDISEGTTPEATPEATPEPVTETPVVSEYEFDERIFNEDKTFNSEGAKTVFEEYKKTIESTQKSADDMRKMVSVKGEVVKDKSEYFKDYKPEDKFVPFFHEDTPPETKEAISAIQEDLAETFHSLALNKRQATTVTNKILDIMESQGVLDTRTDQERLQEKQANAEAMKAQLGATASDLIREAEVFLNSTQQLTPEVKEKLSVMMETDADMVNLVHQLKGVYGGVSGSMPTNLADLSGLGTDAELWQEYTKKETTPARKEEIINLRIQAGRLTPLGTF